MTKKCYNKITFIPKTNFYLYSINRRGFQLNKYKKIVILDSVIIYPEHRFRLEQIADEIVEYNTCVSEEEVLERVKGADCIISCWVDIPNSVIDRNPQIKTIAFWTHAYEHRIDKAYAEAHNIYVPCIPDYGTDSVAELLFIGLLKSMEKDYRAKQRGVDEQILQLIANDVRKFDRNVRANLRGSWIHEYIKNGELKITSPDEFEEDTLKGLTVGLLVESSENFAGLINILSNGFYMNVIHSGCDVQYDLGVSFRPLENLLNESQILIYDPAVVSPEIFKQIKAHKYLSCVDLSSVLAQGESLYGKKLGIVGLGRIGSRVAQIAKDAFNMEVKYYSRNRKIDMERDLGIEFLSIEELFTQSDIITFHLPHVGAEKFITNKMLDLIPKGTIVVNVSVGNIFEDQEYFLNRFQDGDLRGYVDVYETLPPRQMLRKVKNNLIGTYRLGWRTKSTVGLKTHKLITKLANGLRD